MKKTLLPLAGVLAATFPAGFPAALPAQVTTPETSLEAAAGWRAARIHRADGGVWYATIAQAIAAYGAPEVIVCDDAGRLTVLSVYSGKWTDRSVNPDGQWLAPSLPADVDPRVPGKEIYAAGKAGNVHQIVIEPQDRGRFTLRSVEIGHVAGEEFYTVVAADLLPSRPGDELLAFGISGAVYRLSPDLRDGDSIGAGFTLSRVGVVEGRVREAVVLPGRAQSPPDVVGVSRTGDVILMKLGEHSLEHGVVAHEPMGLGRIARRPRASDSEPEVLYVTRDDGVVVRFEQERGGRLRRESIFAGDQGLRGVAAGRFFDDPSRESIAVYGYGKQVQIVSRTGSGPWQVETVYEGEQQGHWLCAGELDGRNATDELVATGFDGEVILLARPRGYGLPDVAVDLPVEAAGEERGTAARPWRIAVKASEVSSEELSPLNYQGGFETKSLVYETLVRRGPDGRIVPGLASSWRVADGGRTFTFELRAGATFHDGEPVTAGAVAVHFKRWAGLPEHAWLRSNERIIRVEAVSPSAVKVTLDRPCALLPDLCAINPTAIRGPGALDREGEHRRAIGSGPFAFDAVREDGRVLRYRRHRAGPPGFVDLVRLDKTDRDDPLDALLRGEVDAVLGSWLVPVDPARVAALRADPRFQVHEAPGSSMTYLGFRLADGPTADRALRRRIAASIDRDELVRVCELGLADPSTGWAAPSVEIWPQGTPPAAPAAGRVALERPLRIAVGRPGGRRALLAETIAEQLGRAGIPAEVQEQPGAAGRSATPGDDGWDLRVEVTHGVPYDPYTTAVSRFTPPRNERNAESPRFLATDDVVVELMQQVMATADDEARYRLYGKVQARIDEEALVVPLYAPRRIAILRAGMPVPALDHDMYALDASFLTDAK